MSRPIMLEYLFCPIMLRPIMFLSIISCTIMLSCMLSCPIMLWFMVFDDMSRPIKLEYMFCPIILRPIMFRPCKLLSLMLEDPAIMSYMLRWDKIGFILFLCIMLLDIPCPIMLCTLGLTIESSLMDDESMNEVILVWIRSGSTERLILS